MSRARPSRASLALVLLVACGKDAPGPSPLIAKTRALADQACACTTPACTEPLVRGKSALTLELSGAELTAEDVEALAHESTQFATCVGTLVPPVAHPPH